MSADLIRKSLGDEEYREYDFGGRVYRITSPVELAFRAGGETHRVTDSEGVVHCLPAPGERGCVLRWKSKQGKAAVAF
jgi:hypothetical protein